MTYFIKNNDPNTIFQLTDEFKLHNFPPESPKTFSYITRTYKKYEKNNQVIQEVDGDPIYFYDFPKYKIPKEVETLIFILGIIQNTVKQYIPHINLTPVELSKTFLADPSHLCSDNTLNKRIKNTIKKNSNKNKKKT